MGPGGLDRGGTMLVRPEDTGRAGPGDTALERGHEEEPLRARISLDWRQIPGGLAFHGCQGGSRTGC
eukprot:1417943-Lingulodinium_polyedra.AAC.1